MALWCANVAFRSLNFSATHYQTSPAVSTKSRQSLMSFATINYEGRTLALREVVVTYKTNVVARVCSMARFQFLNDAINALLAKHGQLPHVPIVVERTVGLNMLDSRIPTLVYDIFDLVSSIFGCERGQVRKRFVLNCLFVILNL